MTEKNKIRLDHSTIELRTDGIVEIHFLENAEIGEKEASEIIDEYDKMLEAKKYPLLHIPHEFVTFSNEAKAFSVTDRGTQYSLAEAYVFTSLAYKLVGNVYLKLNKPAVPTKFFKCKEDAVYWLLNVASESNS